MTNFTPFISIADVIIKGQVAVKGCFTLESGMDRNAMCDEERNYLRIFLPFFDRFPVQKSSSIHMRNRLKIANIFLRSRYEL